MQWIVNRAKYASLTTRDAYQDYLEKRNAEIFTVRSVGELMWGYCDSIYGSLKTDRTGDEMPHNMFGLFVSVSLLNGLCKKLFAKYPICCAQLTEKWDGNGWTFHSSHRSQFAQELRCY